MNESLEGLFRWAVLFSLAANSLALCHLLADAGYKTAYDNCAMAGVACTAVLLILGVCQFFRPKPSKKP